MKALNREFLFHESHCSAFSPNWYSSKWRSEKHLGLLYCARALLTSLQIFIHAMLLLSVRIPRKKPATKSHLQDKNNPFWTHVHTRAVYVVASYLKRHLDILEAEHKTGSFNCNLGDTNARLKTATGG